MCYAFASIGNSKQEGTILTTGAIGDTVSPKHPSIDEGILMISNAVAYLGRERTNRKAVGM